MPMLPMRARLLAGALLSLLLLNGCATPPQTARLLDQPPRLAPATELAQTPFFPQNQFQCGPAALATVLAAGGAAVTPEELAPQVYLPEREGSLQLELIAAARRRGFVPYVLAPELDDLLTEVEAGHPVLVLQNLALSWYPRWHYAVAVGYDLPARELVLRSGRERRHVIELPRFERTWARSEHWALVALPPDVVPATADELPYLKSVAAFEQLGDVPLAHRAYTAAVQRWPDSAAALMGLGNTTYALGKADEAERIFRRLLVTHPDYPPALNNLAQLLAERGALTEAEALAQQAVTVDRGKTPLYAQTLDEIRNKGARSEDEERGKAGNRRP